MSNQATPIKCYVPASVQLIDGVHWMMFYNNGTFQEYKEMPNGLLYQGIEYAKMGWNSDTFSVSYKQTSLAKPA
jgi:hypothetical protein